MAKKKAATEKILFQDEHFMKAGDMLGVHRSLHQDELTYRVMSVSRRKDGWFEASLGLVIDHSKNASEAELSNAIDHLFKKDTDHHGEPSSAEIQNLIADFERDFLGT